MSRDPLLDLTDKVAIVTGASRGIGESTADILARHGAQVVLVSRKPEPLQAAADRIIDGGGKAVAMPAHVGKPDQISSLVGEVLERFGRVDMLVNNAATNPHFGPMLSCDAGALAKTLEVNFVGYFEMCRAAAEAMSKGDGGSIINVASIQGLDAAPTQGVYGASKAAVVSMTKTLAQELGHRGIRVNAVAPGLVRTRFAQVLVENEQLARSVTANTPLGRIGEPEDVARVVLFLASDLGRWMTGQTVVCDGGLTLGAGLV